VKKFISYLWRYIAAVILAVLIYALAGLVLKITLLTVQGPTLSSRVIETIIYYISIIAAVFLLFKAYGRKEPPLPTWQLILYPAIITLLHIIIALSVSLQMLFIMTTGANVLAELMYAGSRLIISSTEMPRCYYLVALVIQGLFFIGFSLWAALAKKGKR